MTFFPKNFFMTFYLVIDQVFRILRFFTVLDVVYDPFFTRKTTISEKNSLIRPFFTLFVGLLSRASDNTAWAVPPPQILGDRPPSPPRSPPLVFRASNSR